MINKIFPVVIAIIFTVTMMPLFTPVAVAQEATATLQIICNPDCIMTLVIMSPVDVSEFQVSIKATNTVTLDTAQASLTGFMTGASLLTLEGQTLNEYRWFNLQSQGGAVGTLSVPISALQTGETVFLDKADFLDENGERIQSISIGVSGNVMTTVSITTTETVISLTTTTSTATTTTTTTSTATTRVTSTQVSTATITQTVTSTNIIVKTQATTVTSGATTTTLTNTQTNTETVEEGSAFGIYAIILAVIAIILLGLAVRQQRKDMFPF
jgi:hypothetical protein